MNKAHDVIEVPFVNRDAVMTFFQKDFFQIFLTDINGNGDYFRYRFTPEGISRRAIPGQARGVFWTTTDEHDPRGHITEGIANRLQMMQKRMGKVNLAAQEIPEEKKFRLTGPAENELLLVGWGSTKGAILDALDRLDPHHRRFSFLQLRMLRPFPTAAVEAALARAGKVLCFDGNYSGQLARVIRAETGFRVDHRVVKYDGRPFSEDEVIAVISAALKGAAERMVVSECQVVGPEHALEQFNKMRELRERRPKMTAPLVPLPPGYNR